MSFIPKPSKTLWQVTPGISSAFSPELAIARVAQRVAQGGHDVPREVVRRRFVAGLRNFFSVCEQRVDSWQVFDNSLPAGPRLIAARSAGERQRVLDAGAWNRLLELGR